MSEQRRTGGPRRGPRREGPGGGEIHVDLGFGDLFKGLGNFLDLIGELSKEGKQETSGTGEVQGPGGTKGVYGFSIKMGVGGAPTVEHFGNVRATERGPEISEVREPLVDVFDEGDHILVVAELPGVAESGITVEARDDIVTLSAEGRSRKYAKEILLPAPVDPASIRQSYQNGVLEVRLGKAKPAQTGS
ncbi:MAG: Hsp20/alpha crystallin family protein [Chloroflexi bacterium]|nr:Hsp20/alpha crystallin family protein [Chloroflexota bacterium]